MSCVVNICNLPSNLVDFYNAHVKPLEKTNTLYVIYLIAWKSWSKNK